MIVSHLYKFQFIHIPRTGGTALTQAVAPHVCAELGNAWYPKTQEEGRAGWQGKFHTTHMHSRIVEEPSYRRDYFTFSIVRNPWDRVVSLWKRYNKGRTMKDFLLDIRDSDKATAARCLRWNQVDWLVGKEGKHTVVDFVCRTERLEKGVEFVCGEVGLPPLKLLRFNTYKWHTGDERTRFDLFEDFETINIAAKIYARDIKAYGYDFEESDG
jgi:hypothetical protein